MLNKIKKLKSYQYIKSLSDIRVLGLIIFGAIALLVSWSSIRVIEMNYKLQQKLARMEEETKLLEMENTNKKLENEYYHTDQYLELQARKQFGKAAPGETVLIVPESIALANTINLNPDENQNKAKTSKKSFYQENFEAWIDFFFHHKVR